ncbi:LysR family transcriptional regulator [Candidatus Bealeia paramacronuclearis]|uniref:LysR family transcriptional regulator n=1 Tax=Candidatus Bealeia paramacronuclearis TaxID=1921001 RepID=A0ABZ2C6Z1_9PROT|nr:LysR family transcriptional regulator [Candidatus Bealeia paramacronuclearis]
MDWDKLRIFHIVASSGSFTKATSMLNISQSAISRQVSILEDELGTPLFIRQPRGLELTESGKILNETATRVFSKLAATEALIIEQKGQPQGDLKVATTLAFGTFWLAPKLKEFTDLFPNIRINVLLKDEDVDLNMREADVGIAAVPMNNPDLVHTGAIQYRLRTYGNKNYFEKFGIPKTIEDLNHHQIIVYGGNPAHPYHDLDFLLHVGTDKPRKPYLVFNSSHGMLEAIKGGMGIASLHRYIVEGSPDLIEVLPDLPGSEVQRYVIYPHQLKHLVRLRVFVDFILKKMKEKEL